MKIRLDVGDKCLVRIYHEDLGSELDIRAEGDTLAEAMARAINRLTELQAEAMQKLREAGVLRDVHILGEKKGELS